jgi:adenine specific DNA methylase Mod
VVLPFQVIEQVDEPREEKAVKLQMDLFDMQTGRQIKGWNNKLIWGDNKLILSSLKNGPLREEIEAQGGIKLIYIDPPFDVGADFSMNIDIGGETLTKKPGILEELAYRDTWGKGADSFIAMIYERLALMRDLLAEDGSIYVHCDWRVGHSMKLVIDEVFGKINFHNHITMLINDIQNLQIIFCFTQRGVSMSGTSNLASTGQNMLKNTITTLMKLLVGSSSPLAF